MDKQIYFYNFFTVHEWWPVFQSPQNQLFLFLSVFFTVVKKENPPRMYWLHVTSFCIELWLRVPNILEFEMTTSSKRGILVAYFCFFHLYLVEADKFKP